MHLARDGDLLVHAFEGCAQQEKNEVSAGYIHCKLEFW